MIYKIVSSMTPTVRYVCDLLTCDCVKCCDERIAAIEVGGLYRLVELPGGSPATKFGITQKTTFSRIPWWVPTQDGKISINQRGFSRGGAFVVEKEILMVVSPVDKVMSSSAWLCMGSRGPVITLGKWLKRI